MSRWYEPILCEVDGCGVQVGAFHLDGAVRIGVRCIPHEQEYLLEEWDGWGRFDWMLFSEKHQIPEIHFPMNSRGDRTFHPWWESP